MTYNETARALAFANYADVELLPTNVIVSRGAPVPADAQLQEWLAQANETERVTAIKTRAGEIILARFPTWKQSNMTARFVELLNIELASSLSDAERAEKQVLLGAWAWVKAVRDESDRLEADPAAVANWPS